MILQGKHLFYYYYLSEFPGKGQYKVIFKSNEINYFLSMGLQSAFTKDAAGHGSKHKATTLQATPQHKDLQKIFGLEAPKP